jgi:hypothetical protein
LEIGRFPILRADRTKVRSAEAREGQAEARPEPAASAVLPAWELRVEVHEAAEAAGEGR